MKLMQCNRAMVILCVLIEGNVVGTSAPLRDVVEHSYHFTPLDCLLDEGIATRVFPGAVALISYKGKIIYHKAFGHYTYDRTSPAITTETLFDIASLTKVIATTTLAMILYDRGQLQLDVSVSTYFQPFTGASRDAICAKHLLSHTSGIQEVLVDKMTSPEELWNFMLDYAIKEPIGSECFYTCTNMIIMQKIIEYITQKAFDVVVQRCITQPLSMDDTCFWPKDRQRCAPTGYRYSDIIQGVVHDDRAFILGGISGNAGLFSTAADLAKFMKMLLDDKGINLKGEQMIQQETIESWTSRHYGFDRKATYADKIFGYGWEIGRHLSDNAFGHFGWTGTSLWADRELQLFCILLTNRTYESDGPLPMRYFREAFHDTVMKIVEDIHR